MATPGSAMAQYTTLHIQADRGGDHSERGCPTSVFAACPAIICLAGGVDLHEMSRFMPTSASELAQQRHKQRGHTFRLTNTENAEGLLKNWPSNMISPAGPKSAEVHMLCDTQTSPERGYMLTTA